MLTGPRWGWVMELARAIIVLIGGIIGLIILLIDLWRRIRGLRPPPPSAEAGAQPTAAPPPPAEVRPAQAAPSLAGRRRVIGRLATWAIGGSGPAIALISALATAGLLAAGFLLAEAVGPEAPDVEILSPSDGDVVPHVISVEGKAREREDGESLLVFIRILPHDPLSEYWPQQLPQQIDDQRWDARPVYVGAADDQPGTPVEICAVITRSQISFSPGESVQMMPAGPYDCVLVTRQ